MSDHKIYDLDRPLSKEMGAGGAKALAALGVETCGDLLGYYPRRYEQPGALTSLADLEEGEHVTVLAQVSKAVSKQTFKGKWQAIATISDGVRQVDLVFFCPHRARAEWHVSQLKPGLRALCTGVVGRFNNRMQLIHPDYELLERWQDAAEAVDERSWPIPIYPASKAIASWKIAKAVRGQLDPLRERDVLDPVPVRLRERHALVGQLEAWRTIHRPRSDADITKARRRLKYQEALLVQCAMAQRRAKIEAWGARPLPVRPGGLVQAFDGALPFDLTADQREAVATMEAELGRGTPMHRLLQGEVGSGKTVVALRAMLQAVDAGGQAALLAPTEVLATQHARTIATLLGPMSHEGLLADEGPHVAVRLLTGSLSAAKRREVLADIASGAAGLVIGTHALFSEPVEFADLALVVVDEQHRFGVDQRDLLRAKAGTPPHTLVMTATPIPRTVAISLFGDLDISELREVPAGRPGITTHVVPAANPVWMRRVWSRLREEVDLGRRAYVVCPRIDEADKEAEGLADEASGAAQDAKREMASVTQTVAELRREPQLQGMRIGMLHGRMSAADKDQAMSQFAQGSLDVLVCTTVVEVGVDVPQASTMVVLDADRFGLSQLHQLRGRVGRGAVPGLALLVTYTDPTTTAGTRLDLLQHCANGFELAEADLRLRKEGDLLGAAQWGATVSVFRALRLAEDGAVIERARADAAALIGEDPALETFPVLARAIERMLAGRESYLGKS